MKIEIWILILLLALSFASTAFGIDQSYLDAAGIMGLKQEAPDFTIASQAGKKMNLNDYRGKVVILHIWATWCKPCKKELPLFVKMYQNFRNKDIVFLPIAVDVKATHEEIDSFAKGLGADFPVYLAREGDITDRYWTWGVPVTYLINKKGWIIGRAIGPRDWGSGSINELINALLEEK